jgi:molecular chaperone DnaJ
MVNLKLKDILKTQRREVSFKAHTRCGKCGGNGCEDGKESEKQKCARCQGRKFVVVSRGGWQMQTECPACDAKGFTIKHECKECAGSGRVVTSKKIPVDIPPGISDGMMIRVRGEGSVGENRGPAGDLVVQLFVEPEPDIQRAESDLITTRTVPLVETIVGGSAEVKTLDGLLEIKVPPGTVHGDRLRIPGRGLPRLEARGRGDFYVKFNVEMPRDLTERQKQLLKDFQDEEVKKRGGTTSKSTSFSKGKAEGEGNDKKTIYDKIKDAAGF